MFAKSLVSISWITMRETCRNYKFAVSSDFSINRTKQTIIKNIWPFVDHYALYYGCHYRIESILPQFSNLLPKKSWFEFISWSGLRFIKGITASLKYYHKQPNFCHPWLSAITKLQKDPVKRTTAFSTQWMYG